MRARVHEILANPPDGDRVARAVNATLMLLIASNVVASILETDAAIYARYLHAFELFEVVSVVVFTLEYVVRLWAEPNRARAVVSPMMLIDLIALAPSYLELLFPGLLDLRFMRLLRLVRVFRLFRIGRVGRAFALLVRVIHSRHVELGVTLAFVAVGTVLAAGAIYLVEHAHPGTAFTSIPRAMWWSVVTITTVGYGDMVPQTAAGQVIGGIVTFFGICALALPVGILSSGFLEELTRQKTARASGACPHCGGPL